MPLLWRQCSVALLLRLLFEVRWWISGIQSIEVLLYAYLLICHLSTSIGTGTCTYVIAAATFIGPVAGPIMGGFITKSYLGWRWTAWITMIMGALFWLIAVACVSESYAPVLLSRRAKKIRFET